LYALDGMTGEHIWRFDCNPKDAVYELGGRGTRNEIISTPVFIENSVVVAVGQDPEHGEGVGHLYRIDATKTGDVSPVLDEDGDGQGEPNPNSAEIWHYGGTDTDGTVTGTKDKNIFRRTISTVAVHDGLVYAADLSGRLHCVDFKTGKRYWEADLLAAIWGSPMVADGKVFIGDEDGDLAIFAAGREMKKIKEVLFPSSIYCTPTIANGVMYVADRQRLYAIAIE
jgi:outer membrane protein assembly factor BamB